MDQELFKNLPSEVLVDILSRLPVGSIIICKCVCKSWLNLLGTDEFVKVHLSQSAPGLALCETAETSCLKIFEFKDDLDLERHELHVVTKLDLPKELLIHGSVNGLLFLCGLTAEGNGLYICNPVTREYAELHRPKEFDDSFPYTTAYGFGESKMTGQHKVVRICHKLFGDIEIECHVYTLGTGSWRSTASGDRGGCGGGNLGQFVNGNLHWLALGWNGSRLISCFDLETELFSTFSCPPKPESMDSQRLSALDHCLCLCENTRDDGIVIWLMMEYGVEKSWTKKIVISGSGFHGYCVACPIKVFRDGNILMVVNYTTLFVYSTKTKTARAIGKMAILHTPTFLSLESFGMENVRLS